jgi:hypothetical protein
MKHPEDSLMAKEIYMATFKKSAYEKEMDKLEKNMTLSMAEDIKTWRVMLGYSWRAVATDFCLAYSSFSKKNKIVDGNQISGMQLCDVAMKILNETIEQGWN